jgi:hypothetical protein
MMLYITSSLRGCPSPPSSETGKEEVGGSQGRIQAAVGRRHHPVVHLPMVQPATHGEEHGWQMASLCQLSPAYLGNRAGCLPSAKHAGFCPQGGQLDNLLHD